jgi:hypothetical protein
MKKALLLLAAVAMASSSFAQGTITFFNRLIPNASGVGTYNAGIFRPGGSVGAGDGFTAGLFLSSDLSTPLATATFRASSGSGSEFFAATQTVTVAGQAPGSTPSFTIRAWETAAGSFAASVNKGEQVFTSLPLGGTPAGGGAPITTPGLTGFTGFTMVPEPSTIALGVLGLGAVAMMRRRK